MKYEVILSLHPGTMGHYSVPDFTNKELERLRQQLLPAFKKLFPDLRDLFVRYNKGNIIIEYTIGEPFEHFENVDVGPYANIASHMNYNQILDLCLSSKTFESVCNQEDFWVELVRMNYPEFTKALQGTGKHKEFYKEIQNLRNDLKILDEKIGSQKAAMFGTTNLSEARGIHIQRFIENYIHFGMGKNDAYDSVFKGLINRYRTLIILLINGDYIPEDLKDLFYVFKYFLKTDPVINFIYSKDSAESNYNLNKFDSMDKEKFLEIFNKLLSQEEYYRGSLQTVKLFDLISKFSKIIDEELGKQIYNRVYPIMAGHTTNLQFLQHLAPNIHA